MASRTRIPQVEIIKRSNAALGIEAQGFAASCGLRPMEPRGAVRYGVLHA